MTTHLHWLYEQGAKEMRGLVTGVGLCGAWPVQREQLTAFVEDADCPACLQRAEIRAKAKKRGPRPRLDEASKWRD